MAKPKLVNKTTISIDGNNIEQFYQFSLSQGIFAHHLFKLVCPAEALDGPDGALLSNSKGFIGADFTIKIENLEGGGASFYFVGIVTQVESTRANGHSGDVIVSGFSPTLVMDNGPHCNSWEDKTLKDLGEDTCGHFEANLPSRKINPKSTEKFAYTVQYKETAWQFLSRLAATNGEWFFYDGENLVLGTFAPEPVDLIYGANLSQYKLALQVRPTNSRHTAYDYVNDKVHQAKPADVASKAGLDPRGKEALQKSNSLFFNNPQYHDIRFLTTENQLKKIANTRAAAQASNMVRLNGTSTHLGVKLGNVVSANDGIGSFTIIEANHFVDGQGHYYNEFIGIPQSIKVPPVTHYTESICETQSAVVTENHDEKGLGRVRVRFHWMKAPKQSPWLRITSPHGGGDKGMHFIPEKKEEVIVGFEGNDPTKAFVIGTTYHGKAKQSYSSSGNDKKAIRTRSGIEILMNDSDGSVTIIDPSGNIINMDGKKNVTIICPETFTVSAKDILMVASNNVGISAKENMIATAKVVGVSADTDLTATGKKVFVQGDAEATISTPKLNLSGKETVLDSSKATLSASGDMTITGGIVKINS